MTRPKAKAKMGPKRRASEDSKDSDIKGKRRRITSRNELVIWRVKSPADLTLLGPATRFWKECSTGLIPVTETGFPRSSKPSLPHDHFMDYPTITLDRNQLYYCQEHYLALIDLNNITCTPWMYSASSTLYDSLLISLKDLQTPLELLNSLRFRELSHVCFSSTVLGEKSRHLRQLTKEWTGKWTAEELVEGLKSMPLPSKKEKIAFLKISQDAISDHTEERFMIRWERWHHLFQGDIDRITEALKIFEDACVEKWKTPNRRSGRLVALKGEA